MGLNFNDYINVDRHLQEIESELREIKESQLIGRTQLAKIALSVPKITAYLPEVFKFFFNDIQNVAENIYAEILHKKDRCGAKFKLTPVDLKTCIENGTRFFLRSYERIISAYSTEDFREMETFNKLKVSFDSNANALCIKQAELIETQYRKLLLKHPREYWTFIGAMVGAVAGVVSVIGLFFWKP